MRTPPPPHTHSVQKIHEGTFEMDALVRGLEEEGDEDVGGLDAPAPRLHVRLDALDAVHVLARHVDHVEEATLVLAQRPQLLLVFLQSNAG